MPRSLVKGVLQPIPDKSVGRQGYTLNKTLHRWGSTTATQPSTYPALPQSPCSLRRYWRLPAATRNPGFSTFETKVSTCSDRRRALPVNTPDDRETNDQLCQRIMQSSHRSRACEVALCPDPSDADLP
jgi:hypothetical protein